MVVGPDGSLFVTNSLAPADPEAEARQHINLKSGWKVRTFEQPPQGAPGLDGIAFGDDGNLYVNTFANGDFFRVEVKDGTPGRSQS